MNPLISLIEKDIGDFAKKLPRESFQGKKFLITGASGLIGTYLLATLQLIRKNGISVTIYATGQSPFPSYIKELMDDVYFFAGDITNHDFLQTLPQADYIIHAAGYGQPGRFMENQEKTIELNTTSTFSLLRKLLPGGSFLFMSTSEVYSGLSNPPFNENQIGNTNTTHPRSCYIEGKRCGEAIVNAFRAKGVDAKSARLSLAYGPGTKIGDARVINSFISRGINERKISLMDRGEAKRTYCYVSDAIELIWNILFKGSEALYNVGGNSQTTIAGLAEMIGKYLDVPVLFPVNSTHALAGAPDEVSLDMKRSTILADKKDFISLNEGVARTIEWQKILYTTK